MEVSRPRILVLEDDPASQKVASGMLDRLGYDADIVASGKAAVEAASRFAYSLILIECQVEQGAGYWAARQIRSSGLSCAAPIIALTIADDSDAWRKAGMDGHLRKPARLNEIAQVVEEWLGQ